MMRGLSVVSVEWSADIADVWSMANELIDYVLTEADRRGLSVSFGIALKSVPKKVTGGRVTEALTGVLFAETIGGHRIALRFEGRPILARAAAPALVGKQRKAA